MERNRKRLESNGFRFLERFPDTPEHLPGWLGHSGPENLDFLFTKNVSLFMVQWDAKFIYEHHKRQMMVQWGEKVI